MSELIIDRLIVIDPKKEEANSFRFSNKSNLIISDGNTIGKSSLMKSIYYSLGADIKNFQPGWKYKSYIFQVDVFIDSELIIIKRFGNIFIIKEAGNIMEFDNLLDYSIWIQSKMGMNLQILRKKQTEFSLAYMDAVLTPFYIDQDKSWSGILFKNSISGLGGYEKPVQTIMEYYLNLSNVPLIQKNESKQKNSKEIEELNYKYKQLDEVISSYQDEKTIEEFPQIDFDSLKNELNEYTLTTNRLSDEISKYTRKLSKIKIGLDINKQDLDELKKLSSETSKRYKEIELKCTHCHSILTREQSLTRLALKDNEFEIGMLSDILKTKILANEKEYKKNKIYLEELKENFRKYNEKISRIKSIDKIDDYVSKKVITELENLKINTNLKKEQRLLLRKTLDKEIRELRKELESKKVYFKNRFAYLARLIDNELKIESGLDRDFGNYTSLNNNGTDLNKASLTLYLVYQKLISQNSKFLFPMGLDSFIKTELDDSNGESMFNIVEKYFLSNNNQTFFSVIEKNLKFFSPELIEATREIRIVRPLLVPEKYEKLTGEIINSNQVKL
ncbi:endonuclease [Lactococcus formosensis]|uniref:endonuclease n=1 Tax=Lactococcus formosensis TaxID=1281486 RepID=UPI002551362F|nr:endonuclease [Lactococcus formosensis]